MIFFIKKAFLLILLFSIFIISCSDNSDYIGITVYDGKDIFASKIVNNIEKFMAGKAKYKVEDSQNNQAKQNQQIDNFIKDGVKVLVINLVDPKEAVYIVEKAKANNIAVIFYNKIPDRAVMLSYDKVWFVGTFNIQAGEMQGKIVSDTWKKNPHWDKNADGRMQCFILEGEPNNLAAKLRTENVISSIKEQGIEIDILRQKTAMWSREKAKSILDEWMESNISNDFTLKIEYIIANSDAMALGALDSIQQYGFNTNTDKYIPIVGVDGITAARAEISNGNMVGTVLNDYVSQAKAIVDMAVNVNNGLEPTEKTTWVLEENKYIRIPCKEITFDDINNN